MKISKCCNAEIIENGTCYICNNQAEVLKVIADQKESSFTNDDIAYDKSVTSKSFYN